MPTKVKDAMLESPPVTVAGELTEGTLAGKIVKLTSTGKLPVLDGSNLTNLDAGELENALPALDGSALTNLDAGNLENALPALDGSALTNLDAGNLENALPALDGSALTNLDAGNLENALPALDGSALTNLDAGNLENALPALDGSALTNLPADPAAVILSTVHAAFENGTDASITSGDIMVWTFDAADNSDTINQTGLDANIQVDNAGIYRIDCCMALTCSANTGGAVQLQKDGGTGTWTDFGPVGGFLILSAYGVNTVTVSVIEPLLEDEKIRVKVTQSGSGTLATDANTSSLLLHRLS